MRISFPALGTLAHLECNAACRADSTRTQVMKSCARLGSPWWHSRTSPAKWANCVPFRRSPALAWLGSGIGGILMSRIAEQAGTHSTVIVVSLMIGLGLFDLDLRTAMPLWIGHGPFVYLIGWTALMRPYIFTSAAGSTAGVARRAGADLKRHLCRRRERKHKEPRAAFPTPGCSYSIIGTRRIKRENAVSHCDASLRGRQGNRCCEIDPSNHAA